MRVLLSAILGVLVLLPSSAVSVQGADGIDSLLLGPIAEITTGWHPAPEAVSVPIGRTLRLRQDAPESAIVTWSGAVEERRDESSSWAYCPLDAAGTVTISAAVESPGGARVDHQIEVTVVDQPVAVIEVTSVEARAKPLPIDEESPNDRVVAVFKNQASVARLRSDGEDGWITSIRRRIRLRAAVEPPVAGSIMEWRVNGEPVGLGRDLEWGFDTEGEYEIAVGPPDAEWTKRMKIYRVVGQPPEEVKDGEVLNLEAWTVPPGYGDEIQWLAATLFGEVSQVLGTGPTFSTTFYDTWGEVDGRGYARWIGVKADQATYDFDDKCPLSPGQACATVTITEANICGDTIRTLLSSQDGASGTFTLVLSGPGGAQQTLVSEVRSDGSYTDSFDLGALATDTEFQTLTATWAVESPAPSDTATAHFTSLGNYRHSQYNCPGEADASCSGTDVNACFTTVDPCNYTPDDVPNVFLAQVELNGCGTTVDHGDVQLEGICNSPPPDCPGTRLRENTVIQGSCGNAVNDSTVAVSPTDLAGDLPCGTNICIRNGGVGSVKTVNDRCPACEGNLQIDNFTTDGRCSGITDACASCLTLKLF